MDKTSVVIAIVGKSASGKDTFAKRLAKAFGPKKAHLVVSTTTRPKRAGEVDGKDYWFVDEDSFMIRAYYNCFVEKNVFRGWYYGVEGKEIKSGFPNIIVVDMRGLQRFSQLYTVIPIYMHAPLLVRIGRYIHRDGKLSFELLRRFLADALDFLPYPRWRLKRDYHALIVDSTKDYDATIQKILDMV